DIDSNPDLYERAWDVSGHKYARAQRSLGKFYYHHKEYRKSALAYAKSLEISVLNAQAWFCMGCSWLAIDEFDRAVEAFQRCVTLDAEDAEAWSNLAAAILRRT